MNQVTSVAPQNRLVLRFISGKYQGGEFPLDREEIVLGRASDLEVVLAEDMVSRRHARILCRDAHITIEDLGSTNGTFVNGEKIKSAALKVGDRILIGTSILKVFSLDGSAPMPPPRRSDSASRSQAPKTMSGAIDEIPIPDLLQLLGSSKKNGILNVRTETAVGKITLRKGNIVFATINDVDDVPPLKSVYRILTWEHGTFEFEASEEPARPGEVDASVQEILMDGLRQIDEFNNIRHLLPAMEARLVVAHPLKARLRDLGPDDVDLLQLAYNEGLVDNIFNRSASTDLDTANLLLKLINAGYLHAE